MPRVPVIDGPRVALRPVGQEAPNLQDFDNSYSAAGASIGRGLQNLGQGVDAGMQKQQAAADKAKQEAAALDEANKLLEQQERAQRRLMGGSGSTARIDDAFDGVDTSKGGFMATKGLDASKSAADTIDALVKDQKEIAETISDPQARARFLVKSREQLLSFRKQVETHAAKQYGVATDETLKALQGQVIGMAKAGVPDLDGWLKLKRRADEYIDTLSVSPDVAKAQRAAFDSVAAAGLVEGMVAQGRTEDAAKYVEENRATLAGKYPEAKAIVDRANAGAEKDRAIAEGAELVNTTAESLLQEARGRGEEFISEEDMKAAVKLDETDPAVRAEVAHALELRIRQEADRKQKAIKAAENDANGSDVDGRPMKGETWNFLHKYDNDFLLAREARRQREAEHRKAMREGGPGKRASEKQQDEDDSAFMWRLRARLAKDPNTKLEDVQREFILEQKARTGRNVMVSTPAFEQGGYWSATAQKSDASKDGRDDKADGKRIEAAVIKAAELKLGKGQKVDPVAIDEEVGRDLILLDARVQANGGKPLTEDQWRVFEADIARGGKKQLPGQWWGAVEVDTGRIGQRPVFGPEAPPAGFLTPAKAAPQAKQVKAWVYSNDRKQRMPRYTDGTLGPTEEVR